MNVARVLCVRVQAIETQLTSQASIGRTITLFRAVRMIRVFRILPAFQPTLRTIGDILPVTAQFAAVLLSNMYFFAVIGAWYSDGLQWGLGA